MTTILNHRLALADLAPRPYAAMLRLERQIDLDPTLRHLVKVRASQLNGPERGARLMVGVARKRRSRGRAIVQRRACVNGQPGRLVVGEDGLVEEVLTIDVAAGGLITAVRVVRNPDKLRHLAR